MDTIEALTEEFREILRHDEEKTFLIGEEVNTIQERIKTWTGLYAPSDTEIKTLFKSFIAEWWRTHKCKPSKRRRTT